MPRSVNEGRHLTGFCPCGAKLNYYGVALMGAGGISHKDSCMWKGKSVPRYARQDAVMGDFNSPGAPSGKAVRGLPPPKQLEPPKPPLSAEDMAGGFNA